MKIFLANDTSRVPHVGCLAVSDAHRRMLAMEGAQISAIHYVDQGEDLYSGDMDCSIDRVIRSKWGAALFECDALVVNGEGTIHHGAGLHLLAMLAAAQRLGKATFLVNAVLQETTVFASVFPRLDGLTVREPRSAKVARALGGNPLIVPDSCLQADFSCESTENWRGEIVVGDVHWSRSDLIEVIEKFATGKPRWLLHGKERYGDWRHAVANLRTAGIYVTGRHHGIYLCVLAGIPFVALPSNTHKIESLIEWSGCDIPMCKSVEQIDAAVEHALTHPDEYRRFRNFLIKQKPLKTFNMLSNVSSVCRDHSPSLFLRVVWLSNRLRSGLRFFMRRRY